MDGMVKTDAPLIDESVIGQLQEVLGPAVAVILSRGREQVERLVGEISDLESRGELEVIAQRAHELGGVAGQVGLARLSQSALALERAVREGVALNSGYGEGLVELARESTEAMPQ